LSTQAELKEEQLAQAKENEKHLPKRHEAITCHGKLTVNF